MPSQELKTAHYAYNCQELKHCRPEYYTNVIDRYNETLLIVHLLLTPFHEC